MRPASPPRSRSSGRVRPGLLWTIAAAVLALGIAAVLLDRSRTPSHPTQPPIAPARNEDATPAPTPPRLTGTGQLTVEVVDTQDRPVASASASLLVDPPEIGEHWRPEFPPEPETPLVSSATDVRGSAVLEGLPTARYRLAIRATGLADAVVHTTVARGVPAAPLRVMLVPERPLRGLVRDEHGAPWPGVRVFASRPSVSSHLFEPALVSRAVTDAKGEFTLTGLAHGEWSVVTEPARGRASWWDKVHVPCRDPIVIVRNRADGTPTEPRWEDRPRAPLVPLPPVRPVRLAGRVVRPDGAPAAGALVWSRARTEETVAAADGSFELTAVVGNDEAAVSLQARLADTGVLRVHPTDSGSDLDLALKSLPTVRGRVRSRSGAAVAGARVRLGKRGENNVGDTVVSWDRVATTPEPVRADGTCEARFEPISRSDSVDGDWVVVVELPGEGSAVSAPFPLPTPGSPHVADLDLVPGVRLEGRVTIERDGAPVEGAHVELSYIRFSPGTWPPTRSSWANWVSASTRADGTFAFDDLMPGRYAVHVTSPRLSRKEHDVEVEVPSPTRLEIVGK